MHSPEQFYDIKLVLASQEEPVYLKCVKVVRHDSAKQFEFINESSCWIYSYNDIMNIWAEINKDINDKAIRMCYLAKKGCKISAIKKCREVSGMTLKDAKAYIEKMLIDGRL